MLALNIDSMLASRYEFSITEGANAIKESYFVIPGMLKINDNKLLAALPTNENQFVMSIRFNSSVSKGVYERIICIFLNACGAIEGARTPLVYLNIARYFFREVIVYLIPEEQGVRIIIGKGWRNRVVNLRDLALCCNQKIGSFFYENCSLLSCCCMAAPNKNLF